MVASSAVGRRDYRAGLEAFFRTAKVPDAKLSAARLSTRYRTLSEMLNADAALHLEDVGAEAAEALVAVRDLMTQSSADELRQRAPFNPASVASFLKTLIGFRAEECLIVLFLDSCRGLIDHEMVAVGGANSVEVDQRRILLRAIFRGASGIIVAHNHPSGDPRPSSSDIRVTRQLADTARGLGICLHDHLVVAGGEVQSAMYA